MIDQRHRLGFLGERLAERRLRREGYVVIERNYRCRIGEVDLIALDHGTVVFIEVKTRSSRGFASPVDAVDRRKQRQIARVGLYYLRAKRLLDRPARFDVVGIVWRRGWPSVEVIRNAFSYP